MERSADRVIELRRRLRRIKEIGSEEGGDEDEDEGRN